MSRSRLNTLRKQLLDAFAEYKALAAFFQAPADELSKTEAYIREFASKSERRDLEKKIERITWKTDCIRRRYDVKVPNSEITSEMEFAARAPNGQVTYVQKFVIESICDGYHRAMPEFPGLPPHARVSVRAEGSDPPGTISIVVEEVVVFEEMCALFNLWKDRSKVEIAETAKQELKTRNALGRATINAAFYFVEAYINGIAFDYLVRHYDEIDEKTLTLLTEHDAAAKKPRYLKLRDKLLQYPRIALGVKHPPLSENNCPELAYILKQVKTLRDSAVHPSPLPEASGRFAKGMILFQYPDEHVEKTVDSAIRLVRRVHQLVNSSCDSSWLHDRGTDGLFNAAVFD